MFKNRSVIEMMVMVFTLVVGLTIISLAMMIVWVRVTSPDTDLDRVTATLMSLLSSMLGALLGLIAGKTSADLHERSDDQSDSLKLEE